MTEQPEQPEVGDDPQRRNVLAEDRLDQLDDGEDSADDLDDDDGSVTEDGAP